jgi:hypothetical protein
VFTELLHGEEEDDKDGLNRTTNPLNTKKAIRTNNRNENRKLYVDLYAIYRLRKACNTVRAE